MKSFFGARRRILGDVEWLRSAQKRPFVRSTKCAVVRTSAPRRHGSRELFPATLPTSGRVTLSHPHEFESGVAELAPIAPASPLSLFGVRTSPGCYEINGPCGKPNNGADFNVVHRADPSLLLGYLAWDSRSRTTGQGDNSSGRQSEAQPLDRPARPDSPNKVRRHRRAAALSMSSGGKRTAIYKVAEIASNSACHHPLDPTDAF